MIQDYLKDTPKHCYTVLLSSLCIKDGTAELHYCIRKHPAENLFSVTAVFTDGDTISVNEELGFVSVVEAQSFVDSLAADMKSYNVFKALFIHELKAHQNVIHVTPGLNILYVDIHNKLRTSSRSGNVFTMIDFPITQRLIALFNMVGGIIHV